VLSAWRQTSFYPFMHASRHGRGTVLRVEPDAPTYEVPGEGAVPVLEVTAVLNGSGLTLFAVNRGSAALPIEAVLRDLAGVQVAEHIVLGDADIEATSTAEPPDRVVPNAGSGAMARDGSLHAELPARSWNVVRLAEPSQRGE
jgi:alpha-L-arabinofuranosidase